jgi:hypothetical protein
MSPWSAAHDAAPLHAMTCDVEDYFQVSAFNEHVSIAEWEHYECRIPRNVDLILGISLPWCAEWRTPGTR